MLLLPIHRACHKSAAASIVVFGPLDESSIFCRRIRWRCCSLCANLPPPKPPSSLYIHWACHIYPAASVVVSDPMEASHITRPLPMPPSSLLIPRSRLTLPMLPSPSSIPLACKHTGASSVGDVHSDALYLLIHQLTHMLLSSRSQAARKHTMAPPPS